MTPISREVLERARRNEQTMSYIGAYGPHMGHEIVVLGRDGLYPDDPDCWLVECAKDGTRWGFRAVHMATVTGGCCSCDECGGDGFE